MQGGRRLFFVRGTCLLALLHAVIALSNKGPPLFVPKCSRLMASFYWPVIFLIGPSLPTEGVLSSPTPQQQQQPYTIFQQQMRPVHKQIRQIEELEDNRLSQCQDKGSKWEQCFFYGTDTVSTNHRGEFLRARPSPIKGGPPTW